MPLKTKSSNIVKVGTVALALAAMTLAHQTARTTVHSDAVAISQQAASHAFSQGVSDVKGIFRT